MFRLFVPSESADGVIRPTAEVEDFGLAQRTMSGATAAAGATAATSTASVRFTLLGSDGAVVATNTSGAVALHPGATAIASAELHPTTPPTPWSTQAPTLYSVRAELIPGGGDDDDGKDTPPVDTLDVSVGFRTARWSADGFTLNGRALKHRGFSHQ